MDTESKQNLVIVSLLSLFVVALLALYILVNGVPVALVSAAITLVELPAIVAGTLRVVLGWLWDNLLLIIFGAWTLRFLFAPEE